MSMSVCPWWLTYTFDNPLRKLLHNPISILGPHVREGMKVADIGCGMGYFTRALAALVGPHGHVQAVDLQQRQLARARARCQRIGLAERVEFTQARPEALDLEPGLDFVLAFWMVHEVPDIKRFLTEIKTNLSPGGTVLIAEPKMHVSAKDLETTIAGCQLLGFDSRSVAGVRFSRSLLLSLPRA